MPTDDLWQLRVGHDLEEAFGPRCPVGSGTIGRVAGRVVWTLEEGPAEVDHSDRGQYVAWVGRVGWRGELGDDGAAVGVEHVLSRGEHVGAAVAFPFRFIGGQGQ